MRKIRLLTLLALLLAVTGAWAVSVYPKYLVVDVVNGTYRYTDEGPDLTKDQCRTEELWLRFVPAGTFTMGSKTDEPDYIDCENQHLVQLTKPYYIGVFECTQYQWAAVIDSPNEPLALVYPSWFRNEEDDNWETRPVERVSYLMIRGENAGTGWPDNNDVDDDSFMGILRTRTSMTFDLPTEAQWEYACRAGTTTALNSGADLTDAEEDDAMVGVGRYKFNSGYYDGFCDNQDHRKCDLTMGTAKVGSYAPNAWGLYDMHGNVLEWCLDWNFSNAFDTGLNGNPVQDPKGETYDPEALAKTRAVRGGGWRSPASGCRSAYRGATEEPVEEPDQGFRIACLTLPDPQQLYTLTVTSGTTAKPSVFAGETVTITANAPAAGQVFDCWTGSDGVIFTDPTDAETTFTMPNKDVTVTATYKEAGTETPTYTARLVRYTVDAANWTISSGNKSVTGGDNAESLKGLKESDEVTLQYNGKRRVKNVKTKVIWDGDLSNIPESAIDNRHRLILTDGMTVTGTLSEKCNVWIHSGATVTFAGVTIEGENSDQYKWAGLSCDGDVTIILKDGTTNVVRGFHGDYPGIYTNGTLTIKGGPAGTGSLTATPFDGGGNSSNSNAAGIGGGKKFIGGNIVIEGGNITAIGGQNSAGIGGGYLAKCGDILIKGGTVAAQGGKYAPGIGCAWQAKCGDITITTDVTSVTATKGKDAPYSIGVASPYNKPSSCGTVTIGGTVYWENDAAVNNDAATYLKQSTITYP